VDAATARLAASQGGVARWKRAQLYQTVFNAKQAVAAKQVRHDDLVATAKDAFRQVELAKQGIVNAQKTVADGPKVIAEKEAQFQKLKQEADAAAAALAAAEKAVADRKAGVPDPKTAEAINAVAAEIAAATKKFEALDAQKTKLKAERDKFQRGTPDFLKADAPYQAIKPEHEKAQTALNTAKAKQVAKPGESPVPVELTEAVKKAELDARLASRKVPAAEKAVAAAKKEVEDAKKQAVELKGRIAQLEKDAAKTKADAEKAAVASAKELQAAKAEADRLRAQYEAAKSASQKAASAAPAVPSKS
jgi:chromosome segregation ATPase